MCFQNPTNNLRWMILRKNITKDSILLMFDRVFITLLTLYTSSHWRCSLKKGVLKNVTENARKATVLRSPF